MPCDKISLRIKIWELIVLSFEIELERIASTNTKKYLKEVISSFNNDNLRSAVVMLYTVFMTDLCEKLNELSNDYNDSVARDILNEIKQKKTSDASRETDIVNKIKERKPELFDVTVEATYSNLKNWRNICAHPTLQEDAAEPLPSPNKELVSGMIRSCIETLFIQSPFLGNKIFGPLLTDVARFTKMLPSDQAFDEYVSQKYINRFDPVTVDYMLKNLFKIVFCDDSQEAQINRHINTKLFFLMINKNRTSALNTIVDTANFNAIKLEDMSIILNYMYFISNFPSLMSKTPSLIKEKIVLLSSIETGTWNYLLNYYLVCESLNKHLSDINNDEEKLNTIAEKLIVNGTNVDYLYNLCNNSGCLQEFYKLGINIYTRSVNFDEANYRFGLWIDPYVDKYDVPDFELLFEKANENGQCNGRYKATVDHKKVFDLYSKALIEIITEEDFKKKWPHFLQ